jgi:hypothetical protein
MTSFVTLRVIDGAMAWIFFLLFGMYCHVIMSMEKAMRIELCIPRNVEKEQYKRAGSLQAPSNSLSVHRFL